MVSRERRCEDYGTNSPNAEAAGLLDLSEHRFHDLLPQPIPASPSCPLQFSSHSLGQRAADLLLDVGRVLGASRRDVSLDDARLEAREVGFAQISAVGGGLPGAATEIGLDAVEGGHELSMVAHR